MFLPGAMQGQLGWKLQGKTFFLAFMGKQLFQITGKSKRKAAVMLLKSFLIIHDHLLLDILSHTRKREK